MINAINTVIDQVITLHERSAQNPEVTEYIENMMAVLVMITKEYEDVTNVKKRVEEKE